MNVRATSILIVLGGMALAASLAVGQATGAAGSASQHGGLPGIVRGTVMIVTPAAGHAGPGLAILPSARYRHRPRRRTLNRLGQRDVPQPVALRRGRIPAARGRSAPAAGRASPGAGSRCR